MPRFNSNAEFAALLSGKSLYRTVELPFLPGHHISVRLLDDLELDQARLAAQQGFRGYCNKQNWDPVQASDIDPDLLPRLVERAIILKAFYDPDTVDEEKPTPFFANERELNSLGSVRVTDLMDIYNEHQSLTNPGRDVSEEEMKRVLESLGKVSNTPESLVGIEHSILRRYVISMARQLSDLRSGKSSST